MCVCVCVCVCVKVGGRLLSTCSYISVFHKTVLAKKSEKCLYYLHFVHALELTICHVTVYLPSVVFSQGYGGQEKSYIATQGTHTVMVVPTI